MRVGLVSAVLLLAAAGCSSNEVPPLQAAVVASSSTTAEPPSSTQAPETNVALAQAAQPLSANGFPEGFSVADRSCYQFDTGETLTTAILYIGEDGDSLVGGLESNDGEFGDRAGFTYLAAAGTRRGTSFSVNVAEVPNGTVENEDWFFEPYGVVLPQQVVLDVIDCDVIVEAAIAIETEVTRFPERP